MTKCNEPWVDWRPQKRSIETVIDVAIRGILRDPGAPAARKAKR